MGRHWKNSDDVTFFTERATHNRLERLRMDLIAGYAERKNKRKEEGAKKRNNKNLKRK